MLFDILRRIYPWAKRVPKKKNPSSSPKGIPKDLNQVAHDLQMELGSPPDLAIRSLGEGRPWGLVVYMESLVDGDRLGRDLLGPLVREGSSQLPPHEQVRVGQIAQIRDWKSLIEKLLTGHAALIQQGSGEAAIYELLFFATRSVSEPDNEKTIQGPHEGLIEVLRTNLNILRRRLRTPRLRITLTSAGKESKTEVAILHLDGVTDQDLVDEVRARVEALRIDAIHSSSHLSQLITDFPNTPFPLFQATERPDRITGNLMEGRVAILVDGDPSALIAPVTMHQFYQSPEDYNLHWTGATAVRILRTTGFIGSIIFPSLYIGLISFHYDMIPRDLLLTIIAARAEVPFPPLIEAILMELTLEFIREAGLRLPSSVGQTIGVVGGLILGQAAVAAGLVSNAMVIVVALTAISNFIIPSFQMSVPIRLFRFPLMVMATMWGFPGVAIGLTLLMAHLCSLDSLGSPYLSPLAPFRPKELKDSIVVVPPALMTTRPAQAQPQEEKRIYPARRPKKHDP